MRTAIALTILISGLALAAGAYAEWAFVENLGSPPNTGGGEKQPAMNANGALLVYNLGGDLYLTVWSSGLWSVGMPLPPEINDGSKNATPCWYETTLYYASDRNGGQGGWDIWYTEWDGLTFGSPNNIGPAVNTAADEYWPAVNPTGTILYLARGTDIFFATGGLDDWKDVQATGIGTGKPSAYINGTLYFTDNRAGGEGGQDIWLAAGAGPAFSAAVNLGSEINTAKKEIGASWTSNMRWMYFSSNRADGEGGLDLYRGRYTMAGISEASLGLIKAMFE